MRDSNRRGDCEGDQAWQDQCRPVSHGRPMQEPCGPRGRTKPGGGCPLKAERAGVAAKGRQIETGAAPIRYVGTDTDSERAIRWLIALMVLCCDPLAIALTSGASARR